MEAPFIRCRRWCRGILVLFRYVDVLMNGGKLCTVSDYGVGRGISCIILFIIIITGFGEDEKGSEKNIKGSNPWWVMTTGML